MLIFSSLLSVIPEIINDFNAGNEITDFSDNEEFGYRLDIDAFDYTNLAANKYPYSNLNLYPDFSSTVYIEGELNSERGWFSGGSGVIIDAYWILTAAHVVEDMIFLRRMYLLVMIGRIMIKSIPSKNFIFILAGKNLPIVMKYILKNTELILL